MQHKIFDIRIDDLSDHELEDLLISFLHGGKTQCIATPNAEMLVDARSDKHFYQYLQLTDVNLPDTVSIRFGVSAFTDGKLQHRHTGVDTLQVLIKLCAQEGKRVLFFGSHANTAQKAIERLGSEAHIDFIDPGLVKMINGVLDIDQSTIDAIEKKQPDLIAIALTHKKQLAFMEQFRHAWPGVKIMIGVGGAIDMLAGKRKRAPKWMRKLGFEWLWRALIEPKRIGRMLKASVVFPAIVIFETVRQRRLIKAVRNTIPEIIRQLAGH